MPYANYYAALCKIMCMHVSLCAQLYLYLCIPKFATGPEAESETLCLYHTKWNGLQVSFLSLVPIYSEQVCIYSWAHWNEGAGKRNNIVQFRLEFNHCNLQLRLIITRFYFCQYPSLMPLVTISLLPVLFNLSVLLQNAWYDFVFVKPQIFCFPRFYPYV